MKFKDFSPKQIVFGLWEVLKRFPLTSVVCLVGTILSIVMIHAEEPSKYLNYLLTFVLAAPLSVAWILFMEGVGWHKKNKWFWVSNCILIGFLVAYYFTLPNSYPELSNDIAYLRHFLLVLSSVLAVVFAPFVHQHDHQIIKQFWEYVRRLVFSTLITGLWTGGLIIGLSSALETIDLLFDLSINRDRFSELAILIFGLFSTIFFLNRLAKPNDHSDKEILYPKEVRLFSQFVLVPLVSIYFLILYIYTTKILLTGEWPQGRLAYIILGFSLVGIVTYFALYPLRKEVAWIKHSGTVLWVAMVPQGFMLLWSLWFRISEYGFTENRYFVLVYGLWLLGVSLYFLISKTKDLRLIPASLFVLVILTSIGPWGASSVAIQSQLQRFKNIMTQNQRFSNGQCLFSETSVSDKDFTEIREVLNFLQKRDSLKLVQNCLDIELDLVSLEKYERVGYLMTNGLKLTSSLKTSSQKNISIIRPNYDEKISAVIDGFQYYLEFDSQKEKIFEVEDKIISLKLNWQQPAIEIYVNNSWLGDVSLSEIIDKKNAGELNADVYPTVVAESDKFKVQAIVTYLYGHLATEAIDYTNCRALIFLTIK